MPKVSIEFAIVTDEYPDGKTFQFYVDMPFLPQYDHFFDLDSFMREMPDEYTTGYIFDEWSYEVNAITWRKEDGLVIPFIHLHLEQ